VSDLISRTARLMPYTKRPKHAASFVTGYIYEPAAAEAGARLGNLYVAVEVLISGRASEEVVDLIIQSIGDRYYNEPATGLEPLARFEAAIRQTNHELSEYVGRGNAAWIGKLSAIVAVQVGSELHVAQTGSAEAFLYRGRAVSRISQTEAPRPATPSKTFGSIATGELEVGDKILLATPALVHQVPLEQLKNIVSGTGPNAAIQELSQLLRGATTNRIAAIIIELTTPELAALKVRSDEPSDIELGNNETITESAIKTAAPIAQATAHTSKRAAGAAIEGWNRTKPRLKQAGTSAADVVRGVLSTRQGRRLSLAGLIAAVILAGAVIWFAGRQSAGDKEFVQYQQLFQQYTSARDAAASGNQTSARPQLVAVAASLKNLQSQSSAIDRSLKNNPLAGGEPATVAGFQALVQEQIDQIDGLIKVSGVTLAQIGGKTGRPQHFESDGTRAYVIDAAGGNKIAIVNLSTGDQTESKAVTSPLGDVKNTTLSASGDGMFILTAKPSVWFYRFATDTLIEQTLAYGQWPKASAIASYGANIYLLGDTAVYKHVKNATGYSPKLDYISTTQTAPNATALAVDGWVYTLSSAGLARYLGPTPKGTADTPAALGAITNLRSSAGGDILTGISQSSKRIAVWKTTATKITFNKQLTLSEGKVLYDALYDPRLGKMFATVDNRLVSFSVKP
jgi:hypothetical protein